ncbi:FxsA family protein [Rhodococcus sp. NPDC059234]|uniref:FxsA family protein n=1 Tax=Rhodococcus sp. NPDC059234 TaxID=3346781 RepID=UPI00366B050F
MIPVLFLLYVVVEVAAVIVVGNAIGVGWTILLFVLGWAVGAWLVRSQFRRVFEQFRQAGSGNRSAGGAVADGALVAAGTALLIVPGLVTSALGLLLLIPPTRRVLRPLVLLFGGRKIGLATAAGTAGAGVYARTRRHTVVDGVVVEDTIVTETVGDPFGAPGQDYRPGELLAIEGEVILPDPGAEQPRHGRAD